MRILNLLINGTEEIEIPPKITVNEIRRLMEMVENRKYGEIVEDINLSLDFIQI